MLGLHRRHAGRQADAVHALEGADGAGVYPPWLSIKADDTEVGIAEGTNAGAGVGVAVTGTSGHTLAETQALAAEAFRTKRAEAAAKLTAAGATMSSANVAD